jgi:hypothetical protein
MFRERTDGLLRSARNDAERPANGSPFSAYPGDVSRQTPVAGTEARTYSSLREHHMTNIIRFFSTRTLLQIVFVLGSAVTLKAWSLGLLFGG